MVKTTLWSSLPHCPQSRSQSWTALFLPFRHHQHHPSGRHGG